VCDSVQVLNALQNLTESFVKKVCANKGMPEHIIKNSGGKIFTYGSYRLGVYAPGEYSQFYPPILLMICPLWANFSTAS